MAGPAKKRAQAEKNNSASSEQRSSGGSGGRDATPRSTPKSIPRLDGTRERIIPEGKAPADYSKITDLKNISEFLGLAGWYTARGVSPPISLLFPFLFVFHACEAMHMHHAGFHGVQTLHVPPFCCLALPRRSLHSNSMMGI